MYSSDALHDQELEFPSFLPDMIRPTPTFAFDERSVRVECVRCRRVLPLRLTRRGEEAAKWLCRICELPVAAVCIREALSKMASLVQLDEQYFDTSKSEDVPPELHELVAQIVQRERNSLQDERRRSPRVAQCLVVPAVCLDRNLSPQGEPFKLMVANISREGVGLMHSDLILSDEIALEFCPGRQDPIQVIVRLLRERPLEGICYEFGGEFLARLGGFGG